MDANVFYINTRHDQHCLGFFHPISILKTRSQCTPSWHFPLVFMTIISEVIQLHFKHKS